MPVNPNSNPILNKPFLTPIISIKQETPSIKTYRVRFNPLPEKIIILPGQFFMVWIPGNDEIPMSISRIFGDNSEDADLIEISVAAVGEATKALHNLKIADLIGIRGPYGNNFNISSENTIIIGGGVGMASVMQLARNSYNTMEEKSTIIINGARTKEDLLFQTELSEMNSENFKVFFCTDDGSYGFHGFTTQKLEEILGKLISDHFDADKASKFTVYTCGPEIMMKKISAICFKWHINIQASLERMMRCGFGICGLCALDPTGLLVCKDGPIFGTETLKQIREFGVYHRDFTGKIHNI